ncbi:2-phosphosulfolactate phosphatase family protein [Thermostilla marina]
MNPRIIVHSLPSLAEPSELSQGTVVVIDILRASTTIVYALEAGAEAVYPCRDLEDARRTAESLGDNVLLGGERKGLPPEGFDLGNSPGEYEADRVAGKRIVFTTTNGTLALSRCEKAERVLIGSFVNATAVYQALLTETKAIHLLCAGTDGDYSRDDTLFAGFLVDRLQRRGGLRYDLNAQAITARENWRSTFAEPYVVGAEPITPEMLAEKLQDTEGGQNLVEIGLTGDILDAARIDKFKSVPELDVDEFVIRRP